MADGYQFKDDAEKALHCHASRDGECGWEHCPQLRDNEPYESGRHCPYDHWCFYCDEDTLEAKVWCC